MVKKVLSNPLNQSANIRESSVILASDNVGHSNDFSVSKGHQELEPSWQDAQKIALKNFKLQQKTQTSQLVGQIKMKKKSIKKTNKNCQLDLVIPEKQKQIDKRVRNRIREKWRKRALKNLEKEFLEPGFKSLNKDQLIEKDLTQFDLILDDQNFYGSLTVNRGEKNQYTAISYKRPQQTIKTYVYNQHPIHKKSFKVLSINMDLGNPPDYKTYHKSNNNTRTQDFIQFLRQSYEDGFDFIFIQELVCYSNCKMVYDALESRQLPYFYAKSMLPQLLKKWHQTSHCCYHTIVLSRYPAKFGDYSENFSLVNEGKSEKGGKTFRFIEFKIMIRGQEKIVKMLSTHLKANYKKDFESPTVDYQFIRDKQIELLSQFSQTCDIFLAIGDVNIGTNERYYLKGNLKIRQNFVDLLDLDCCKSQFQADVDGTKYGTYMWQDEGIFSMDRLDRALIKLKDEPQQTTKTRIFAHVQTDNPELSSCKYKGMNRKEIYMAQLDHCNFINLSDHSALKCIFGFKNQA